MRACQRYSFVNECQFGHICAVKRNCRWLWDCSVKLWVFSTSGWFRPTLPCSLPASDWALASPRGWARCPIRRRNFESWDFQSRTQSSAPGQARCSQRHQPGPEDNVDNVDDVDRTSFPVRDLNIELNFPIWPYHGVDDSFPSELKIDMCCHAWYFPAFLYPLFGLYLYFQEQ